MADPLVLPDFDSLPKVEGMPQGCAWGIFDKGGKKDVLGTVNILTPSVVKAAATEVKEGVSVSLNWPIGAIETPGFGRKGLERKLIGFKDGDLGAYGFDDEVAFNTQCSSQWDSLCHFHHQPSQSAYNGHKYADLLKNLEQPWGQEDKDQSFPTLQHWHSRGGLVGRGVLIDYVAYVESKGGKVDPFSSTRITVQEIEEIAKHQGVEFKQGDIIIIRSGYTEALTGIDGAEQQKKMNSGFCIGVDGTQEAAKWFWNKHFAAVAGDAIGFEAIPPMIDGKVAGIEGLVLHQYFLGLFGLPIGELWALKALSEQCAKSKKYSFLFTSSPLNVPGSIGSPPNALAIF